MLQETETRNDIVATIVLQEYAIVSTTEVDIVLSSLGEGAQRLPVQSCEGGREKYFRNHRESLESGNVCSPDH